MPHLPAAMAEPFVFMVSGESKSSGYKEEEKSESKCRSKKGQQKVWEVAAIVFIIQREAVMSQFSATGQHVIYVFFASSFKEAVFLTIKMSSLLQCTGLPNCTKPFYITLEK